MKLTIERLVIEIIAALLLVVCVTVSSAAFAAGKTGRTADGLGCNISLPQNASPAARCAAIRVRRSPSCLAVLAFPIADPRNVTISHWIGSECSRSG